ncbi:hypothetical protein HK096_001279, partial [Nowakowskiella sp. JEL0078]
MAPISINFVPATVRTPRSFTTSFMDASQIYGVEDSLLAARRDGYKFRMINITLGNGLSAQLPIIYTNYNKSAEFTVKVNLTDPNPLFDLGVIGGNTSPASQSLHTLFIREHNRKADEIKNQNPALSDDDVFAQA